MTKQIYIHIGFPKTATTTIQSALVENAHELIRIGVLYPNTSRRQLAHHDLGFQVSEDPRYNPTLGSIASLKEEISQPNINKVVISAESLAVAEIHQIQLLKEELSPLGDIKIVVYLRRQDLWLQSLWSQLVKSGFVIDTFGRFLDKAVLQKVDELDPLSTFILKQSNGDFYSRINRWEEVFGKRNIVVRTLESREDNRNLSSEFLEIVGVSLPYIAEKKDKNISPSLKTLEVIRHIVSKIGRSEPLPYPSLPQHIASSIRSFAAEHDWNAEKLNVITAEHYQRISAAYAASNEKLAHSYFGRKKLFLEPFQEHPVTEFTLNDIDTGELLDLLTFVLGHVSTKRYFLALSQIQDQENNETRRNMVQKNVINRLREENAQLLAELMAIKKTK